MASLFSREVKELNDEFKYILPVNVEDASVKSLDIKLLDGDGDGVADINDACKDTPKGQKVDKDGCKFILDTDKDGVADKDDMCEDTPKGALVNSKGCELDSDGDGVFDSKDKCPNTKKSFLVDDYGCPETMTLDLKFDSSKAVIKQEYLKNLDEFVAFLKEHESYQVVIFGYTDTSGNAKSNKTLSQNRANSVKKTLAQKGIKTSRLTAIGEGGKNPIADNATVEGRAKNRRIEVELIR